MGITVNPVQAILDVGNREDSMIVKGQDEVTGKEASFFGSARCFLDKESTWNIDLEAESLEFRVAEHIARFDELAGLFRDGSFEMSDMMALYTPVPQNDIFAETGYIPWEEGSNTGIRWAAASEEPLVFVETKRLADVLEEGGDSEF